MSEVNPFDLLYEFEQRILNADISLPLADEVAHEWTGLGFRIGDDRLMADMGDIKEILELPELTIIPGVKSWMVGVANVRGNLLPILDLRGYVTGEDLLDRHSGRLVVIDYKGFNTGLIVEEIYGMRHFRENEEVDDLPSMNMEVESYVSRAYRQGDEHWPVFDFDKMKQEDDFALVSL